MIFLLIRLKQFYRTLIELGLIRSLFLIIALAFIYYIHLKYYWLTDNIAIILFYVFIIISFQLKRRDKSFLKLFKNYASFIVFTEYLFFALPLIILALIKMQFMHATALIISCFLISYFLKLSFNHFKIFTINYQFKLIEWYLGMRRNAFFILLLNILAIVLFRHFSAQIIIAILLSFILMTFFLHSESKEILEIFSSTPSNFMKKKIRIHLGYTLFSILIPLLVIIVFHFQLIYVALIILILIFGMQIFAIYLKYALYDPGEELAQNTIFHILFFIGFIFPFFTPIAFYFLLKFRTKALKNLNFYLND
jgi:hypothetical protein